MDPNEHEIGRWAREAATGLAELSSSKSKPLLEKKMIVSTKSTTKEDDEARTRAQLAISGQRPFKAVHWSHDDELISRVNPHTPT